MTARSLHSGIVEMDPALYRRAGDPLCAARVRDGVMNGVVHKADARTQVHVNWQPVDEDLTVTGDPERWATWAAADRDPATYSSGDTIWLPGPGTFFPLAGCPIGVIDVPLYADGSAGAFRIRSAWGCAGLGLSSSPPAGEELTVRVYLYPLGAADLLDAEHNERGDHVWEGTVKVDVVGYAGDWAIGATRGPNANANLLELSPDVIEDWGRSELLVPNDVDGGSEAPTQVLRVGVGVAAASSVGHDLEGATLNPLLRALHLQGFVGPA